MKKIGIVSEYFYPHLGGITEHVYYFSKELIKRGFEVVLLTGYQGEEIDVEIPKSLRILRLGKSIPMFSNGSYGKVTVAWNLGKKIREILRKEQFDLLHIHSPIMMTLPLLFQKYTNTVTIGTFHTYFDSLTMYQVFQKVLQKYIDKLDGCIAVAASVLEAMNRYFRADYKIIPNGVETEWFGNPSGKIEKYADGSPNILFLGRLDPRNGLDTLLEAFPKVLVRVPGARLLVAGSGPMQAFYKEKAGSLLGRSIFFEGQVNGNRPDYFATSDVFCYPATKASFGITLLESMAASIPVVAADNQGFRDIIQDGVNGLLVQQENPEALAQTLVRVIQDKSFSKQLAENGKKSVEQFSWAKVTDQVLEFYNEVYLRKKGERFAP
jgi:phosphatidylinositol alpha-mannosyltransferase